jgi:acyl-CoA thioesterase
MADRFPLQDLLGLDVETLEPGVAAGRVDIGADLLNPNGVVHGGVLFTMVDTAMGLAVVSLLGPDGRCASVEIHMRFLETVSAGTVEATATVTRPGRRVMHVGAEVRDADGALVATATGTFIVIAD